MNKIIILSALTLTIMFSSCNESIIDLLPTGATEGSFYRNEEDMEKAVFGIYQKNCFFYGYLGDQNNALYPVYLLPGDDVTTPATVALENFTGLSDGNSHLGPYYQYAYQLIARANVVLDKIATIGDQVYTVKPEQRNWNKGEALFFRAYMHMNLWNVFGTVPLVTEIYSYENSFLPNTKGTELLDQAIIDLGEAATLLPASWEARFAGRVTRNSALGLRGKALVFRGQVNNTPADFTAAIADFNSLSGLALTAQYSDNFNARTENNVESLFEYQANSQTSDANPWLNNDEFSVVGDLSHWIGMYNFLPNWIGNTYATATPQIIEAYEEGDPRKAYNLNTDEPNFNIMKYVRDNVYDASSFADWMGMSVNNPRILRYADILLLKAEAIVRSGGNLSEAIGLINQIRERARNSVDSDSPPSAVPADRNVAETDRSTVLEWVFQERRLELAFEEGHRWWDLRRRHMTGEIDLKTYDFGSRDSGFKFEDYNIYFPIPGREVVDNEFLNQNPGY